MPKFDFAKAIDNLQHSVTKMEEALASVEEVVLGLEGIADRNTTQLPWEQEALLKLIARFADSPCEEGYEFIDRTAAIAVLLRAYQAFYQEV